MEDRRYCQVEQILINRSDIFRPYTTKYGVWHLEFVKNIYIVFESISNYTPNITIMI